MQASVQQPARQPTAQREKTRARSSPPRAAKGVSSIRGVLDGANFPSRPGPMRYECVAGMPFMHKLWMTLDDPTFINNEATGRMRYLAKYLAMWSMLVITSSTFAVCFETDVNCKLKTDISAVDPSKSPPYGHVFVTAENCASWEEAWEWVEALAIGYFALEVRHATSVSDLMDRMRVRLARYPKAPHSLPLSARHLTPAHHSFSCASYLRHRAAAS